MTIRTPWRAGLALAAVAIVAGCGSEAGDPSDAEARETATAELLVERDVAMLEPSEVRIGAVGAGGAVEGREAARSETRRIDQILSELNAERVEGSIRINLPESVLFEFDEAELRPQAVPTLAQLAELAAHYAESGVRVEGHTDSRGTAEYNQELSERRAETVRDHLVQELNLSADRIQTRGYGATRPVAPNESPTGADNPAGREQNRRVEVIIEGAGNPAGTAPR